MLQFLDMSVRSANLSNHKTLFVCDQTRTGGEGKERRMEGSGRVAAGGRIRKSSSFEVPPFSPYKFRRGDSDAPLPPPFRNWPRKVPVSRPLCQVEFSVFPETPSWNDPSSSSSNMELLSFGDWPEPTYWNPSLEEIGQLDQRYCGFLEKEQVTPGSVGPYPTMVESQRLADSFDWTLDDPNPLSCLCEEEITFPGSPINLLQSPEEFDFLRKPYSPLPLDISSPAFFHRWENQSLLVLVVA